MDIEKKVNFGFAGIALLLVVFMASGFYISGTAKSEYLKQAKGIDMPWWQAYGLPSKVFYDANLNVGGKKNEQ